MPLETINYIPDLNVANPTTSDGLVQGDDHLRGIKAALKNTFPNFTGSPLISTQSYIDLVCFTGQIGARNGASGSPSVTFLSDGTTGFYHKATGQTGIAGRLWGNGAVACGSLHDFPKAPSTLGTEYLECDGTLYNISSYPDLGTFLGSTFGGDGVNTFCVPNLKDTGRFRRSRTTTLTAGTYQTNAFKTHAHTSGVTDFQGSHTHTATSLVSDPGHTHAIGAGSGTGAATNSVPFGSGRTSSVATDSATTGITVATSMNFQGNHAHGLTIPSGGDGGDTETRPESFVVIACIKT